MSRIAIHGFYGMGNLGDEVILKALLQELDRFPEAEVIIFSRDPEQVSRTHGVRSLPARGRRSFLRRIWEIKTSDLFALGGGGLLKDYGSDSSSLKGWLRLLRLAKRLNVKTTLWAVGVENIRYDDSKKALRDALDGVDLITVRDSYSKQVLRGIGIEKEVKVVTDPAVLLANPKVRESKDISPPPKVMISVRHWFSKGEFIENPEANETFIKSLGAAADYLVERYSARIDFVPLRTTSYDDDRVVARQVVSCMKHGDSVRVLSSAPGVDEFAGMVDQYSLVIGMRLHSLILATAAGLPVIGLEYMPKVRAYMESIDQGDYSLDLEAVTSDRLVALIEDTFDHYNTRSQLICSEISKLQNIARDGIAELVELAVA